MALLLAKRLTNQITRLAEQAGIMLECDLHNFHNDGERRAAGCEGTIRNPITGVRVKFLSRVSRPDTVSVGLVLLPYTETPDETFSIRPSYAAEKIVDLLLASSPTKTHNNLAESRISNLPGLDKNPLLAAYLSDVSTSTRSWVAGRSMLEHTIQAQGFNLSHYTCYPPSDNTAYGIDSVLWNTLAQSCTEPHVVCHHLLAYHDVCPSETVKGRLAYYQDDSKRAAGIRTPIKVRKYLQKFFGKFRTPEALEQIAKTLDELMVAIDEYDVRIYDDSQIDGWADAYYHIASCMSTKHKTYGVGKRETYRCYCTSAMTNGKKSSGLSLVVLYQDDKPVARAITYESYRGEKCYVRNYGDDRLVKWLDEHGYVRQQRLPRDTWLWAECYDAGNDEYLSPYVDGDGSDACATLEFADGQPYWVLSDGGVVLQNCCGYTSATIPT